MGMSYFDYNLPDQINKWGNECCDYCWRLACTKTGYCHICTHNKIQKRKIIRFFPNLIIYILNAFLSTIPQKPEPTPKEFDFDNAPPRLAYSWKDEAESMKLSILHPNITRLTYQEITEQYNKEHTYLYNYERKSTKRIS